MALHKLLHAIKDGLEELLKGKWIDFSELRKSKVETFIE